MTADDSIPAPRVVASSRAIILILVRLATRICISATSRAVGEGRRMRAMIARAAGRLLQPLEIAAKPVKVVGDAEGRSPEVRRMASVGVNRPRAPCTVLVSSSMTQTSLDNALRGRRPASASSSDKGAREAAGKSPPAGAVEGHEHPQRDGFWFDSVFSGAWRKRMERALPRLRSRPGSAAILAASSWRSAARQHHRHDRRRGAIGGLANQPAFEVAQHGADHRALADQRVAWEASCRSSPKSW